MLLNPPRTSAAIISLDGSARTGSTPICKASDAPTALAADIDRMECGEIARYTRLEAQRMLALRRVEIGDHLRHEVTPTHDARRRLRRTASIPARADHGLELV